MPAFIKRALITITIIFLVGALTIASIIGYVQLGHLGSISTSLNDLEPAPYAIILGASVKSDGTPSDALYDRILVGLFC